MRYDQSMRLESDKYDKSLDELEDEVCELKETLKEQERIIGELRRQLAVQNA